MLRVLVSVTGAAEAYIVEGIGFSITKTPRSDADVFKEIIPGAGTQNAHPAME